MRICITNDDGIQSEGLRRVVAWAGKLGEVSVYAPKVEQSAKSHAVEIHKPFEARAAEVSGVVTAYAVDSTPADCIRFAVLGRHEHFDLVISGMNRGLNIGQDVMYSGTVSAAMEAVALGMNALALSTDPDNFESAMAHLDNVWRFIQAHDGYAHARLWNVNIPQNTTGEIHLTRQGGPYYSDDFLPEANDLFRPMGKDIFTPSIHDDLDTDCVLRLRHISLTPLTIDRTDWRALNALQK